MKKKRVIQWRRPKGGPSLDARGAFVFPFTEHWKDVLNRESRVDMIDCKKRVRKGMLHPIQHLLSQGTIQYVLIIGGGGGGIKRRLIGWHDSN